MLLWLETYLSVMHRVKGIVYFIQYGSVSCEQPRQYSSQLISLVFIVIFRGINLANDVPLDVVTLIGELPHQLVYLVEPLEVLHLGLSVLDVLLESLLAKALLKILLLTPLGAVASF